jgi:hypothetical protein
LDVFENSEVIRKEDAQPGDVLIFKEGTSILLVDQLNLDENDFRAGKVRRFIKVKDLLYAWATAAAQSPGMNAFAALEGFLLNKEMYWPYFTGISVGESPLTPGEVLVRGGVSNNQPVFTKVRRQLSNGQWELEGPGGGLRICDLQTLQKEGYRHVYFYERTAAQPAAAPVDITPPAAVPQVFTPSWKAAADEAVSELSQLVDPLDIQNGIKKVLLNIFGWLNGVEFRDQSEDAIFEKDDDPGEEDDIRLFIAARLTRPGPILQAVLEATHRLSRQVQLLPSSQSIDILRYLAEQLNRSSAAAPAALAGSVTSRSVVEEAVDLLSVIADVDFAAGAALGILEKILTQFPARDGYFAGYLRPPAATIIASSRSGPGCTESGREGRSSSF